MSKLEKGYGSDSMQAILGDVKTYYEGELAKKANTSDIPVITGKADKVTNATSGHLAGLDANGNLTDSGVSPTEEVTVEGNPVTFDSPFEQDAKSVVVSVKPIQDLHGYDAPWVGGSGKNKLPLVLADIKAANIDGTWNGDTYVLSGMSYSVLTNNGGNVTGINIDGTTASYPSLVLYNGTLPLGNYILTLSDNNNVRYRIFKNGDTLKDSSNPFSFAVDNAEDVYLIIIFTGSGSISNVLAKPMLRLATETDPTFAPYSNECPISGTNEVEIARKGGNIFDGEIERGAINSQGQNTENNNRSRSTNYIPVIAGHKYIFEINGTVSDLNVYGYDSAKAFDTAIGYFTEPFTIPSGVAFIRFYREVISVGDTVTIRDITTTTIPLPSTLYDADVDVTEGDANSTHELKAISASDDIVFAVLHSGCDLFKLNGVSYKAEGNIISNMFKGDIDFAGAYSAYINSTGNVIFAVPTGLYNASQFKAFLVEQGCTICCELATPTTLSFDPTDVELLEGTNVVTTNAEKVAVTYGRSLWQDISDLKTDTEGKLDKSDVATIEGDTASRPYSVNEFMLRADGLYKVTAPIASGASITASNTTKTTIGAVLTALLNA